MNEIERIKQLNREKAKRYYHKHIATDTVEVYCEFCKENHTALRLTYDKNIKRNGRYICEKEGGHIAGSKPKLKLRKENPYAVEGKKRCNKCGNIKHLDEFSPDKTKRDGYSTRCKTCRAKIYKEKYNDKRTT